MSQTSRAVTDTGSVSLAGVQIQLLPTAKTKARARRLLAKHHYLGDVRAVGEQLFYAITDGRGDWLGVLVFCAASRRLRARDRWIGWSEEQRRRRLPLVVNNCHSVLTAVTVPSQHYLGSAIVDTKTNEIRVARAQPPPRRWSFPAWSRSRYCAGTWVNTHLRSWPW